MLLAWVQISLGLSVYKQYGAQVGIANRYGSITEQLAFKLPSLYHLGYNLIWLA